MHAWKVTAVSIRTGETMTIEVDADDPAEAIHNAHHTLNERDGWDVPEPGEYDHSRAKEDARNARQPDECYGTDGQVLPYGRCDTCGAPCSADGCTVNTAHEIALDG